MQKVKISLILLIGVFIFTSFNTDKQKNDLWQSWTEIQSLMKENPKPIIIDMYADWCVYCKQMDRTTYENDSVYNYMKEHFYRFKFNAESKEPFVWNSKTFGPDKKNNIHEFFEYVAKGDLVLPTTVIITTDNQPYATSGMLYVKNLEVLLKYYSTDHGDQSFPKFAKHYKTTWK